MSFEIVKNLIPGLPQEAYANGIGKYVGVLAHSTANNGDSADGERSYESRTWNSAFVHFFVDDTKIEQTADTDYLAYGAGHTANHLGFVQVELCQTTDAAKFALAYARYVWILAKVLYDRKIPVINGQTLMSHAQSSAKWHETDHTDPIQYLASHGKTWTNVVDDVTSEYKKMEGGNVSAPVTAPSTPTTVIGSLVITTKLGLNLRQEANTTATVLTVVPFNTCCPVVTVIEGWYQIQYEGKTGWVSAQYVNYTANAEKPVEKPVDKPAPVVAPKVVAPIKTIPAIASVITPAPKPVIPSVQPKSVTVSVPLNKDKNHAETSSEQTTKQISTEQQALSAVVSQTTSDSQFQQTSPEQKVSPKPTPIAPTPVPEFNIENVITDILTDPANVLVLKQVYVFLNKIFGGK